MAESEDNPVQDSGEERKEEETEAAEDQQQPQQGEEQTEEKEEQPLPSDDAHEHAKDDSGDAATAAEPPADAEQEGEKKEEEEEKEGVNSPPSQAPEEKAEERGEEGAGESKEEKEEASGKDGEDGAEGETEGEDVKEATEEGSSPVADGERDAEGERPGDDGDKEGEEEEQEEEDDEEKKVDESAAAAADKDEPLEDGSNVDKEEAEQQQLEDKEGDEDAGEELVAELSQESSEDEHKAQAALMEAQRTLQADQRLNDLLCKVAAGVLSSRGYSSASVGELSSTSVGGGRGLHEDLSSGGRGGVVVDGQETRYIQSVFQWAEMKHEVDRGSEQFSAWCEELQARLEGIEERARSFREEFFDFRRRVGVSSRVTLMGRVVNEERLDEFLAEERRLGDAISAVRLRNIMLRNGCKLLSARVAAKEELAHGLHLIDFEQLKIENASLAEKIGERTSELSRLRKKHTVTVMVLTHMKEKLQFCEKENLDVAEKLAALDHELQEQRDKLQSEKKERDRLRCQAAKRKSVAGRVADPNLIKDYNARREALIAAKEQIAEYSQLLREEAVRECI